MAANRYSLVFVIATLIAVGATYGVYRFVEGAKANNRVSTAPVVIAARDIAEGTSIDRLAVVVTEWPTPTVPAGAFAQLDSVAGRVARISIFKGEPIVPGRLAPEGTGPGLEVKIPLGKRAMPIRVNDVSGIAGMVLPNSRVDIMVTISRGGVGEAPTSKVFMSNMRILAVGAVTQRGPDGQAIQATVATLEVTPDQAELLGVAQSQGSLQLVLRGYGDADTVQSPGMSAQEMAALFRNASRPTQSESPVRSSPLRVRATSPAPPRPVSAVPVAAPPAAPPKPDSLTIQIYRGGKSAEQLKFKKDSLARRDTIRN